MSAWLDAGRPGYLGGRRDARYAEWDQRYGSGNWRMAWRFGEVIGDFDQACMWYEDAYFEHMRHENALTESVVREACDVYDDAPSNAESGLDYRIQETPHTHIQDIAIRRCLVRLGLVFRGSRLIQIRDAGAAPPIHPLSFTLSPARVPFHRPDLVLTPVLEGWWSKGESTPISVEAWYQSNRVLEVREYR